MDVIHHFDMLYNLQVKTWELCRDMSLMTRTVYLLLASLPHF